MDILGNGLVTLANGALTALTSIADPVILVGIAMALSLLWLALVEVDELDRQGTKPEVGRH